MELPVSSLPKVYKIFISAAEASSDNHAAGVLEALQKLSKERNICIRAFGVGGPRLQRAGLIPWVDSRSLLVMGFTEILSRIFRIFWILRKLHQRLRRERPHLALLVDYPEFHIRLAKWLKSRKILALCFIPPKIWVWRFHRIAILKSIFKKIFCIFPFEESIYRKENAEAAYVGNPSYEALLPGISRQEARRELEVTDDHPLVIAAFLGSRPAEWKRHLPLFVESFKKLKEKCSADFLILLALPPECGTEVEREISLQWGDFNVKIVKDKSAACFRAADFALVKSGTSCLEAAILNCPHIMTYKTGIVTYWIVRYLIRYLGPFSLPNILLRKSGLVPTNAPLDWPVPELVGRRANAASISEALYDLCRDDSQREFQKSQFGEIRKLLKTEKPSSANVAEEILRQLESTPVAEENDFRKNSRLTFWVSALWSCANYFRRRFHSKKISFPCKTVSIGNLQAGGTGKTPLLIELVRSASEKRKSVWVLTRGYRSYWENSFGFLSAQHPLVPPKICGDETAQIHKILIEEDLDNVWIGVGADRVRSFNKLMHIVGRAPDLVLIDDGFQNFRIKKDLEILLVTDRSRTEAFFRDFSGESRFVNFVVQLKGKNFKREPFGDKVIKLRPKLYLPQTGSRCCFWAIAGIGDCEEYFRNLAEAGLPLANTTAFEDHYKYAPSETQSMIDRARALGTPIVLTKKDAVKWAELGFVEARDFWVVDLRVEHDESFRELEKKVFS